MLPLTTLSVVSGQLSLFAADTQPPAIADLEGLLLPAGQLVTRDSTARLSVVVDEQWRVEALLTAFAARDLPAEPTWTEDGQPAVRTSFVEALSPLAERWTVGARKHVPAGFRLSAPQLRLWAIAAGRSDPHGYLLRVSPYDEQTWPAIGATLSGAGIAGVLLGPRAGGPAYRVTGQRRLTRVVEMLGDPPPDCPDDGWPALPAHT